ncbi:MAG: nucleotidyltransferase domain-containing protein [SAR324 cluster bacterium]|nr:nucleotidyltransferase domain-containing protein [SAR324 cluster bacterium]MCH8884963.1 nucleotidyltransferase domain-containing protein [SAR324 cluster bacterium]
MNPIIAQHLPELRELCIRYQVARLELIGSAAIGQFDPSRSDLDFLVTFSPGAEKLWMGEYFGLKRDLEALTGRSVDLVMPGAIRNPYFLKSVSAARTLLCAA